jgi:hypothetical protein
MIKILQALDEGGRLENKLVLKMIEYQYYLILQTSIESGSMAQW